MKLENIKGVYTITNKLNNNIYVGISENIHERWNSHIRNLKSGKHHQHNLQKEYNDLYDEYKDKTLDMYEFKIVEKFNLYDKDIAELLEDKYILKFRDVQIGYEQKTNYEIHGAYLNRNPQEIEFQNNKKIKELLGNYFFINENVFKLDIEKKYIFRFLYLCCFVDFDNKVKWGNGKNNFATKKDLFEIFNNSKKACYETINILEKNNLIKYKNNLIVIPDDVLKHNNSSQKYNRFFINGIKSLYIPKNKNIHEKIGIILSSLPKIVCAETNLISNEMPTMTSLSSYLGFSTVQKFKANIKDTIIKSIKYEKTKCLIVNPIIFYNGKDIDNIPLDDSDLTSFNKEVNL